MIRSFVWTLLLTVVLAVHHPLVDHHREQSHQRAITASDPLLKLLSLTHNYDDTKWQWNFHGSFGKPNSTPFAAGGIPEEFLLVCQNKSNRSMYQPVSQTLKNMTSRLNVTLVNIQKADVAELLNSLSNLKSTSPRDSTAFYASILGTITGRDMACVGGLTLSLQELHSALTKILTALQISASDVGDFELSQLHETFLKMTEPIRLFLKFPMVKQIELKNACHWIQPFGKLHQMPSILMKFKKDPDLPRKVKVFEVIFGVFEYASTISLACESDQLIDVPLDVKLRQLKVHIKETERVRQVIENIARDMLQ